MSLLSSLKRWWNVDMPITKSNNDYFYSSDITLWYELFEAENLGSGKYALNLPKAIVNDVVRSATKEFSVKVESKNKNLLSISNFLNKNLNFMTTHLCVGGSIALKPYVSGTEIGVAIIPATNFKATYDSFGKLKEVFFKSVIKEDSATYTLVESHKYNPLERVYRIDYSLYKGISGGLSGSNGWGLKVPLSTCKETAGLNDFIVIEDVSTHLCSVKTIGNSPYQNSGEAVYANAIGLVSEAYSQFERVLWEYKGGELSIQANSDLFHKSGSSLKNQKFSLPSGKERLYVALPGASNDFNIETFAPSLRDSNYWEGFNNILRRIEFNCGLSYGVLSDASEKAVTATEVISSKQRYYVTISAIRTVLKDLIAEIISAASVLSATIHNGLIDSSFVLSFEVEDGVLSSTKDLIEEKLLLYKEGILTLEEFKEWYFKRSNN